MLRHTLNGRQVLTIEDLAARYDVTEEAIRQTIARADQRGKTIPIAGYCGRKALYDPKVFDRARGVSGH
jgi:DeoR/GlpR family transcriptional regulator of sugar metabolism